MLRLCQENRPSVTPQRIMLIMAYYLLTIEYDGTDFHGWQRQPGMRTVQGEIETALSAILNERIDIHGVSRTDAGVHAYAQMAGFSTKKPIPAERLKLALNNALCSSRSRGGRHGDVRIKAVRSGDELQDGFHARHSAVGKTYIYRIMSSMTPDIFLRNHCWQISFVPDVVLMREAAVFLTGVHDFKAFQSAGGNDQESTIKTVYSISIYQEEHGFNDFTIMNSDYRTDIQQSEDGCSGMLKINNDNSNNICNEEHNLNDISGMNVSGVERISTVLEEDEKRVSTTVVITGSGFLYNMVRIITGTLAEVGEGKRAPESVKRVLEAKDRTLAGPTAPPQGLYLARVYYR